MTRAGLALLAALGLACAAEPARAPDTAEEAARVAAGFREAAPWVDELLAGASAWAVFPFVEDVGPDCEHAGLLHRPGEAPAPVLLLCLEPPSSPGGSAGHLLVVLRDPGDLARLAGGGLPLEDALRADVRGPAHDPGAANVWIVGAQSARLTFVEAPRRRVLRHAAQPIADDAGGDAPPRGVGGR